MDENQSNSATTERTAKGARRSIRNRVLFFVVAWTIVLLPFLFWRSTWFGRPLNDEEIGQYLRDEQKPRHIQHALVQMGERMSRQDPSIERWYPEVVRLSTHPVEEIRNTAAWLMGQDDTRPAFHEALRGMLDDPSPTVRANAALSLISFEDRSGHPELLRMLEPASITAPQAGRVLDLTKSGTAVRKSGVVARLDASGNILEVRTPIQGRIRSVTAKKDAQIDAGREIAVIDPAAEQVWEALRGLLIIGVKDDLPAVRAYQRELPEMPERIRQQAVLTEKAILERAERGTQ